MKKTFTPPTKAIKESLTDTVKDGGEVFLDQFLVNGFLKDFPVLSTVIGVVKTCISVKDYIFLKKLKAFFDSSDTISEEQRKTFNDKLDDDPGFREKVGTQLIMFLEQANTIDKAALLAKAYSALIRSAITYDEYLDLGVLINDLKHSMLENMCLVLVHASSEDFDDIKGPLAQIPLLETIELLRRDNLLIAELKSNSKLDTEKFTGRYQDMKVKTTTETLYRATKLAVNFITYVVPDVYSQSKEKIIMKDGYLREGVKKIITY